MTNETHGGTITIATVIGPGQTLVANMDTLVRRAPGPYVHIDGATRYSDWTQPRVPLSLFSGDNIITATVEGEQDVSIRLDFRATYL